MVIGVFTVALHDVFSLVLSMFIISGFIFVFCNAIINHYLGQVNWPERKKYGKN